jgi:hypothetical protein
VGRALGAGEGPPRRWHGSVGSGDARAPGGRDLTEGTIAGFTGGDPGITESLGRMYRRKVRRKPRGTFDADLLEYVTRAQATVD